MATLFYPKQDSFDLKLDYPELKDNPRFNKLSPRQLRFVFYMGNRSSPYARKKMELKEKVEKSLRDSSLKTDLSEAQINNYKNGLFEEKITVAIDEMSRYMVSQRVQAKIAQEAIYDMTILMISKSQDDVETADAKKRGEILDFISQARKELPAMLQDMENGFGITLDSEEKEVEVNGSGKGKFMDQVLKT